MPDLQTLRSSAHHIARFVLMWFVLSLGVAVASPLVNAPGMELICTSTGGIKILLKGDASGEPTSAAHTLDCPLCIGLGAPPPVATALPEPHFPLSYALRPTVAAHIAARVGAALPARGPPG